MPGIDELFSDFADITRVEGRSISHEQLKNADVLLCRSITNVDQNLLNDSAVKFVGTATIGIDHIDTQWLESKNIQWANAAGCNAAAVAQYVLSAMAYWSKIKNKDLNQLTVGIIGAGNVGTELTRCLDKLKIAYRLYDPPLKKLADSRYMVSFAEVMKCDVITLHVPIVKGGNYPTQYMIGKHELEKLNETQLLINACRGAVIDNRALVEYLKLPKTVDVVLDVFETEPNIPKALIDKCLLTTPHIAGHTIEGKLRGTWLVYRAFCKCFNISPDKNENELYPTENLITFETDKLEEKLLSVYDIKAESDVLNDVGVSHIARKFDQLRKKATQLSNGRIRRDYSGWQYQGIYRLNL